MIRKRRHVAQLIGMVVLLTLSAGCWDRKELDSLGIVAGVGIDLTEDKQGVVLTAQVIKAQDVKGGQTPGGTGSGAGGGGGGATAIWITQSTGRTVAEAKAEFTTKSGRKLYWAHNQIIVLGKEAATAGVIPLLDEFVRNPEDRRQVWMLVADGKASDIIKSSIGFGKIPALEVARALEARQATSHLVRVNLQEFLTLLISPTKAPVASWISMSEDGGQPLAKLGGSAIFKDDKLVGRFDQTESRGLLWVLGEVEGGIINVKCPGDAANWVSLGISTASGKITSRKQGENVGITVEVSVIGGINSKMCQERLTTSDGFSTLERRMATAITEEINRALSKGRQLKTDVFGFGEAIHKAYPELWKGTEEKWDQVFPTLDVEVKAKAHLKTSGIIIGPIREK